jgi:hypothetical protein
VFLAKVVLGDGCEAALWSFDLVFVLNGGRWVYQGPMREDRSVASKGGDEHCR